MSMHASKTTDIKSQSVSNSNPKKLNNGESALHFSDNRPEAVTQRKLQERANKNPNAESATQLQTLANGFSGKQQSIQRKQNNSGLPDNLKSGIESLSGISMDDVKVHHNSAKPAQLQAHAYAQGSEIYLAPGQEKHLPHEAWHVVQQKQGRVKPTIQLKGEIPVNDDAGLEREADIMGVKALNIISDKSALQAKKEISVSNEVAQKVDDPPEDITTTLSKPVVKTYGANVQENIDQQMHTRTLGQQSLLGSMMPIPIVSTWEQSLTGTQEEASSSPAKITKATLEGLSSIQKALVFLKSYPNRYHDAIGGQIKLLLAADKGRMLLSNATHLLDAVLENFDSGDWDMLARELEHYVDEPQKKDDETAVQSHEEVNPAIGNEFKFTELQKAIGKIKGFNGHEVTIINTLVSLKGIKLLNPLEKKEKKHVYVSLAGLENIFDSPIRSSRILKAAGIQGYVDENSEPLGKLREFFTGKMYIHPDVREKFEQLKDQHSSSFKDWFHGFANTMNLMSGRSDVSDAVIKKILKYELTKYQLQATYNLEDTQRLGRQTSPLVMEGYARGIKTGMYDLSRKISEAKLQAQFEMAQEQQQKKAKIAGEFNVFPAPSAFPYNDQQPQVFETVPADINSMNMVYISSLKVQLIKASGKNKKQEEGGQVSKHMGGKGLRSSASESTEVVIEEMLKLIKAKNLDGALDLITKLSYENKDSSKKEVIKKLKTVTLNVNTLIAPQGSDPLTQTATPDLKRLKSTYKIFCSYSGEKSLPFYVTQNVKSIENLLGKNENFLFGKNIPATASADLSDTLYSAVIIITKIKSKQKDPYLVEKFYQQIQNIHHSARFALDLKGDSTTMDEALIGMLPQNTTVKPRMTQVAPHGLAMIDKVAKSLPPNVTDSTALMHGAYYETPHLFEGAETKESVEDPTLRTKKLIVMEPHPNNAASAHIQPHDPVKLIKNLFTEANGPYTVIMDVTLNHLSDKEIEDTLNEAEKHINSGKLNLILLQSGTKFFQNGMDLVNIGTAIMFNDGKSWTDFNSEMSSAPVKVPKDDELYIANMLVKNKETLKQYLDKIRSNTASLRNKLSSKLGAGNNAFEVVPNSDKTTVYISFQPSDAFVRKKLKLPKGTNIDVDTRAKVNNPIYFKQLLPSFKSLPSIDRSSFGFNITNFGECYNTVRITPGIENEELLEAYSDIIARLSRMLWMNTSREADPQRYEKWMRKRNWQKLLSLGMITEEEAESMKEENRIRRSEHKKASRENRHLRERPDPVG